MNTGMLRNLLLETARELGWTVEEVKEFELPYFHGRDDPSFERLKDIYGLRLGDYPVIVAPLILDSLSAMRLGLRRLHSQMVVARSYMRPQEVINSHLILCAMSGDDRQPGHSSVDEDDWRRMMDAAQRDETVCRKIVWMPNSESVEESYARFIARTFLSMPWNGMKEVRDASLDRDKEIVERALVRSGLDLPSAKAWIEHILQLEGDSDALVAALTRAQPESK